MKEGSQSCLEKKKPLKRFDAPGSGILKSVLVVFREHLFRLLVTEGLQPG